MKNKTLSSIIGILVIALICLGAYCYIKAASSTVLVGVVASSPTSTVTSTPVNPTPPVIPSSTATLSPESGPVGTVITIHDNGFALTGNTVTINGMVSGSLKSLPSNGNTIVFTMPSSLGPNCKPDQACPQYLMEVTNNTYAVAVISPSGVTQAVGNFTVTGGAHLPM